MSLETPPRKHTSRWASVGGTLLGVVYFWLLGDLILRAVKKVINGQGLDTYRTFWEVEFSYIGVLVLFAAIPLALVVGALIRLREHLQWRDLERKYRARNRDI